MTTDKDNGAFKAEADALVARKSLLMLRLGMGRINSSAEWFKTTDEIGTIDKRMKEMREQIEAGE